LSPRIVTGIGFPRKGLAGRSGQTVEPQSKAARLLVAPRHDRQKRRTEAATVGGDVVCGPIISLLLSVW